MRTTVRVLATIAAVVALCSSPAVANAAEASSQAKPLVGTWVGPMSGYRDGEYVTGSEKIIITQAKGPLAKGTWQWKAEGGTWSKKVDLQLVIVDDHANELHIFGQDPTGTYDGHLYSSGHLVLGYAASSPMQFALRFDLSRR